jgi:hypothetical protein
MPDARKQHLKRLHFVKMRLFEVLMGSGAVRLACAESYGKSHSYPQRATI